LNSVPTSQLAKGGKDKGSSALPSRQDAFLTGLILSLCRQSPAMWAYLRDSEVDAEGNIWLIFYKLPATVVGELNQVINVAKKEGFQFMQHDVLFTAIKLTPTDEEMTQLSKNYHDKAEEEDRQPRIEKPREPGDSNPDRVAKV
jgi:hypothetical protein